jgi:hypothetical protein
MNYRDRHKARTATVAVSTNHIPKGKPDPNRHRPGQDFANGDIWCAGWADRIDRAVCVTRSYRQPGICAGCPFSGKGGKR